MSRQSSIPAALTLFFVAPLVAEYLLGDLPITFLPLLILMAPMYGGGALLIREAARRTGRGWPAMFLLSAAYALIEEGFATQSLFNPNFLGMHFLRFASIPALGIGAWWTMLTFNCHIFWSMGVPIALAEGLFPTRARTPWLGKTGLSVVAAIYVVGVAANAAGGHRMDHFVASHTQFATTALFIVLFIAAAFLAPRSASPAVEGAAPSPWLTGAAAFLLGAMDLLTPPMWGWGAFASLLSVALIFFVLMGALSRRSGWTALHTLSLGVAGALAYGLHAFLQPPVIPAPQWVVRGGNAVFFVLAIVLIVVALRRTKAALAASSAPVQTASA